MGTLSAAGGGGGAEITKLELIQVAIILRQSKFNVNSFSLFCEEKSIFPNILKDTHYLNFATFYLLVIGRHL